MSSGEFTTRHLILQPLPPPTGEVDTRAVSIYMKSWTAPPQGVPTEMVIGRLSCQAASDVRGQLRLSLNNGSHVQNEVLYANPDQFIARVPTALQGALTVSGTTTLASSLSVSGAANLQGALTVTGAASLASSLSVAGAASLASSLNVSGAANLQGALTVTGAATLSSSLAVAGAASLASSLNVSGAANLQGALAVVGVASLASSLSVSGAATLASSLAVVGAASLASSLNVSGAANLQGALTVTGAATLSSSLSVAGAASLASSLNVSGAANLQGALTVTGAASLASSLSVSGAANLQGALTVTGAASLASSLSVSGAANLQGALTVTGASSLASSLTVAGATVVKSSLDVSGTASASGLRSTVYGTEANPAFAWAGSTAAGMFAPAADTVAWSTVGVERARIAPSGFIGVGTTAPSAPLEVGTGTNLTVSGAQIRYFSQGAPALLSATTLNTNVSVISNASIWVKNGYSFLASSDQRIKKDVTSVPSPAALEVLNALRLYQYRYVDVASYPDPAAADQLVYGFLAQQVRAVLPEAVSLSADVVPSVYQDVTVQAEHVTAEAVALHLARPHGLAAGATVRLYEEGYSDTLDLVVTDTPAEDVLVVPPWRGPEHVPSRVFVYGHRVNDFHTLDKTKIAVLAVGAIQELSRKYDALAEDVARLRTQLQLP